MSRFRLIAAEKASYPIALLCRVLGVSRAGYYAWSRRALSTHARTDAALAERIRHIHAQSRRTYGAPRVQAELLAAGVRVARKRVARLLRTAGLRGCARRRAHPRTTLADPAQPVMPNLVARNFAPAELDHLWVGDLTYVPTGEGWLYLALLLDACSRRVIGWAMADHLRTELAVEALTMALRQRRPTRTRLVHHTDCGCQYTAAAYQVRLSAAGLIGSMSRAGDCYDNALAESFFATLKTELIHGQPFATRRAAQLAIFEWIEVFYNRQRRHSALGYLCPVAFEERQQQGCAA